MSNVAAIEKTNEAALTSRKVVTVACKLPHGLIIRDHSEHIGHENVLGGGTRKVKMFRPTGTPIRIKGPVVPDVFVRLVEVVGGYAITEGVDAEVFGRWLSWNKESAFVVNKMVFGHEDGAYLRAWAKEHSSTRSGMEAIDVTLKSEQGKLVYVDPRVRQETAEMFKAGADANVA